MMGMFGGGFMPFGGFIHILFSLIFLIGLVLFIVWLVRTLKKDQLLPWAVGLLIVGIIGGLLTMWSGFGGYGMMGGDFNNVDWESMIEHMQDEDHSGFTNLE